MTDTAQQRVRLADTKPYAVPDSLEDLTGPATGPVTLSKWVYWAPGDATFDVGTHLGAKMAYTAVLSEGQAADICEVVNADRLRQLWGDLLLPVRAEQLWVQRFPELAA